MKKSNRYKGFWNSDAPLTSKRGRFVLSSPVDSEILINAVRRSRDTHVKDSSTSVKIEFSEGTARKLKAM